MHLIKASILGALGGLAAALALWVGLYVSPIRQEVYFASDPEMADVRGKLIGYQEWLSQTDLRIAERDGVADSLRTAQAKAWRDYKGWRTRLGELARAHAQPTAGGFWDWTYSLRYWSGPITALMLLLPALLSGWRASAKYRPTKTRPGKASRSGDDIRAVSPARSKALSDFEDAVKQVARISQTQLDEDLPRQPGAARDPMELESASGQPADPDPYFRPLAEPSRSLGREEPPTDAIPVTEFTAVGPDPEEPPMRKEPETVPFSLEKDRGPDLLDTGRDTRYFQVGPGWGEPPAGDARIAKSGLSMEDEDAPARAEADDEGNAGDRGNGEETLGVMPPTTEVERVERRKEEVLKLARKGLTSSEISRRMRISQDQVEFIIRLRREKG